MAGLIGTANQFNHHATQKSTKKLVKQQAEANAAQQTESQRRAVWEAAMLEQAAYQSQMLARIVTALEDSAPRA